MLNAAFIFIAPEADPETHRATVKTPEITLTSIGVSTFEEGAAAAKEMVDKGCTAIELCGGFGIKGTWIVEQFTPDLTTRAEMRSSFDALSILPDLRQQTHSQRSRG